MYPFEYVARIRLWLICLVCLGCAVPPERTPESLESARALHERIMQARGNPPDHLLREDWPAGEFQHVENVYQYALPYFPFAFCNMALISAKEAVWFPTIPVTAGTKWQDDSDHWIAGHCLSYENTFRAFWPEADSEANYLNMDEFLLENLAAKLEEGGGNPE